MAAEKLNNMISPSLHTIEIRVQIFLVVLKGLKF